jgi:hypothetical protein
MAVSIGAAEYVKDEPAPQLVEKKESEPIKEKTKK